MSVAFKACHSFQLGSYLQRMTSMGTKDSWHSQSHKEHHFLITSMLKYQRWAKNCNRMAQTQAEIQYKTG